MTTIHDVARLAGVAPITVSRVINQKGYFSEDARQRVENAIAELEYVPNRVASSLRSKRTHLLALVLTDITNPYFTLIARGVEDTASAAGYAVIYCNTDESLDKEQKYLNLLLQNQVEGILLVPAAADPHSVEMLHKNNTPVVLLDRRIPGAQVDIVRSDSLTAAYRLVKLLLGLGHRRIVLLNGPKSVSTAQDRLAGYHQALDEFDVPSEARAVYNGRFTQDSGHIQAIQALVLHPAPTAMLAANNFIAIGALRAIQECGLRVPEDIALVGFDDLPAELVTFPFLTVAAQPAYEMGCAAAQLLLDRLQGKDRSDPQEIVFQTELVIHHSSGEKL